VVNVYVFLYQASDLTDHQTTVVHGMFCILLPFHASCLFGYWFV